MLMVAGVDLAVDDLGVIGDNDSSNCWRRIAEQHTDAEFDTLVLFHVTLLGLFFRDPGFRVWDVWASISYNYSHDSIHYGDRYGAYFDDVFQGYMWLILLMYTRYCHTLPSIWTSFRSLWLLVITIMLYYSGQVAFFDCILCLFALLTGYYAILTNIAVLRCFSPGGLVLLPWLYHVLTPSIV